MATNKRHPTDEKRTPDFRVMPNMSSMLLLHQELRKGDAFNGTHLQNLVLSKEMGPTFIHMSQNCDPILDRFFKTRNPKDYLSYTLCVSTAVCPVEVYEWRECLRSTRSPNRCFQQKHEVERCGTCVSEQMLKTCLNHLFYI
mmetsp:Transcript_13564/g.17859  ORF Transcript_13564/g.17859 Transcript_13564/m.17859 type:complete len:142 (-) Transcript_13564:117-542(-)